LSRRAAVSPCIGETAERHRRGQRGPQPASEIFRLRLVGDAELRDDELVAAEPRHQRMFRRSGRRFADKNMRQMMTRELVPIRQERNVLPTALPGHPPQPFGDGVQQDVAAVVPERVVHVLEPIDVDDVQRDLAGMRPALHQRMLQPRDEACAIDQPGERIMMGEKADASLRPLLLLGPPVPRDGGHAER
jgi:hypothetical protein